GSMEEGPLEGDFLGGPAVQALTLAQVAVGRLVIVSPAGSAAGQEVGFRAAGPNLQAGLKVVAGVFRVVALQSGATSQEVIPCPAVDASQPNAAHAQQHAEQEQRSAQQMTQRPSQTQPHGKSPCSQESGVRGQESGTRAFRLTP